VGVSRWTQSPCGPQFGNDYGQRFLTDAVATLSLKWSPSAACRYVGRESRLITIRVMLVQAS
jgi:hypothetical protein